MISNSILSKSRFLILLLALPALLSGCFGDGDDPASIEGLPKLLTGVLWDARVSGVQYYIERDPTTIRQTSSSGEFEYRVTEDVTFMIGDIMLGTVEGAPVVTPVDLTGSLQAVDQAAVNMMMFLQSIDDNEFPLDTITVTDDMIANASGLFVDFNSANFSNEIGAIVEQISPGNAVVDAVTAINNFYLYGYQQFGGSLVVPWEFGTSYSDGTTTVNFAPFPDLDNPVALNLNADFEADTNRLKSNFDSLGSPAFPAGWVNGWGAGTPEDKPPAGPNGPVADLHSGDYACGGNDVFDSGVFASGTTVPIEIDGVATTGTVPAAVSGSNVLLMQVNQDGLACSETTLIIPDVSYTASVQVQSDTDNLIIMEFIFVDEAGEVVSSAAQLATTVQGKEGQGGRVYLAPDTWTPLTIELTAPADAVRARLVIGTLAINDITGDEEIFNNSGPTYFDDAQILGPDITPVDIPLQTGELLTNGSFESPVVTTGNDASCSEVWECFNSSFTTVDGPVADDGLQVLKQFGADGGAFQAVPALPGETYTATVEVQDFVGDPLSNEVSLQLSFLDAGDATLSQEVIVAEPDRVFGPVNTSATVLAPDVWTELQVSAVSPPGTAKAQILLIHSSVAVVPEEDQAVNGSFESPDASGGDESCTDSWTCTETSPSYNLTVSNSGSVPVAVDGTQMLRQTGDFGSVTRDATATLEVPVLSGRDYTAMVDAHNFSGDALSNEAIFELFFLDDTDAVIGGAAVDAITGVAPGVPTSPGVVTLPLDTWTTLMLTGTAPVNAVKARIVLSHGPDVTFAGSSAIFWDNVTLVGASLPTGGSAVFWDNASLVGPLVDNRPLVFAEEFNDVALDGNFWNIETGYGPNNFGWGNDEWQNYQASAISFVDTGSEKVLRITADCPSAPCGKRNGTITSARITTQDKFSFTNGRVEARIRVPNEISSWPAFWMLGSKITQPGSGWPKAGEIDILEVFDNKSKVSGAIHFCNEPLDSNNNDCQTFPSGWQFIDQNTTALNPPGLAGDQFRVYVMEWSEDEIVLTVDGVEYFRQDITVSYLEEFQGDFFFLLNVAVGGNVTNPSASTTWPMIMDVDYIRVYRE